MEAAGTEQKKDLIRVLAAPSTVLLYVEILCAIIVFGTIADHGGSSGSSSSNMALATGVMAFLAGGGLLALAIVSHTSSALAQHKQILTYAEAGLNAFFAFMWLIAFGMVAHDWSKVSEEHKKHAKRSQVDAIQSVIAFSFFSWILWSASFALSVISIKRGDTGNDYVAYQGMAEPMDSGAGYEEFHDPPKGPESF